MTISMDDMAAVLEVACPTCVSLPNVYCQEMKSVRMLPDLIYETRLLPIPVPHHERIALRFPVGG